MRRPPGVMLSSKVSIGGMLTDCSRLPMGGISSAILVAPSSLTTAFLRDLRKSLVA